jgi:hypothetical protein
MSVLILKVPLVREILPELVNQILVLISSDEFEQQEVISFSDFNRIKLNIL